MKRILVVLSAVLLLTAFAPRGAYALNVKDVIAMSQYGIPDSLIVAKIRHSDARFHLNADDLLRLRAAKVPDDVVVAMLRTEDRPDTPIWYDGRYWAYDPAWYLGVDLGWNGFHDGWWGPAYRGDRWYAYGDLGRGDFDHGRWDHDGFGHRRLERPIPERPTDHH